MQGHLAEAGARLRESLRLDADQLASPYYLALVARDQGKDAEATSAPRGAAPPPSRTTPRRAKLWED
jgi:cytochrome c-type biogenesis protein CcmH/NrfG